MVHSLPYAGHFPLSYFWAFAIRAFYLVLSLGFSFLLLLLNGIY